MWILPAGLLLVAGLVGCSAQPTPTAPASKAAPLPGWRVERLRDAEQAVEQLRDYSQTCYVYKIDGDLATCRFEITANSSRSASLYLQNQNLTRLTVRFFGVKLEIC